MTTTTLTYLNGNTSMLRQDFVHLLRTSLTVGSHRFARQAGLLWLAHYPGDLPVNWLYNQSLLQAGMRDQAIAGLRKICQADPEYLQAQTTLAQALQSVAGNDQQTSCGELYVLGGEPGANMRLPDWAYRLREARTAIDCDQLALAEDLIHQVLLGEPATPLTALLHLELSSKKALPEMVMRDLARHYRQHWPDCVACILWLAHALLQSEEADRAVALLHQAVARDITGQVATRLWGENHSYQALWPARLAAPLDLAIPAPVAVALGWNQLPAESPAARPVMDQATKRPPLPKATAQPQPVRLDAAIQISPPKSPQPEAPPSGKHAGQWQVSTQNLQTVPETLRDVQDELERVADRLKRNHIARSDGRFPVYVVFSTQQGLRQKYGSRFGDIDTALRELVSAVAAREDWRALLIYPDDPESLSVYGIQPAEAGDAWGLKLVLADLDLSLARQGEMIGAVLIVGGPDVVPFHHLPNPVDDVDIDAPSDNPYATRDENYFIPEWLVGRLPGGEGSDPEALLHTIRSIAGRHRQGRTASPWYRRWVALIKSKLWFIPQQVRPSWGYTAAVWRRSALSVFRPIGPPHALLVSPPIQVNGRPGKIQKDKRLPHARLGYFNLHGLQDASEWYGQRDPAEPEGGLDYPVALRPEDVADTGRAPEVVFSEACYGAHIIGKNVDQALALKFLASGSQAVIGSTVTAYGSITPPLIAADLLGHTFWRYLREGIPAGEALRRAKIHLAREMLRRQGYLDGEDQKTLITFVYFGDPLAQPVAFGSRAKTIFRPLKRPKSIKTVCDRAMRAEKNPTLDSLSPIPAGTLAEVKHIVQQYLPGMQDAEVLLTQEHANCRGGNHTCPTSQLGRLSRAPRQASRSVVTLSKRILHPGIMAPGDQDANWDEDAQAPHVHWHYARLTLDQDGNIVKLAVSR
ncbi:MAG TPA: hypothetical protein VFZ76_05435 [Anaerolineales bacterium]